MAINWDSTINDIMQRATDFNRSLAAPKRPIGYAEGGAPVGLPAGVIPGPVQPDAGDNTMTPTQTGEYIIPVDAIIAKGRELAPKLQLTDQDAHAIGKMFYDQETAKLKEKAGNDTPPRNAGQPVGTPQEGMAEGGGIMDTMKRFVGLGPNPLPPLINVPAPQPTPQPQPQSANAPPTGLQRFNPLTPVINALTPKGYAEGGLTEDDWKVDMPQPALGIPSGAPDIAGTLAAPTQPGYVAPAAPVPKAPDIVNSPGYEGYIEGGPQGLRALRHDDPNSPSHVGPAERLTPEQYNAINEWDRNPANPANAAETARVAGLPPGTPSYMQSVSDTPGGSRTVQIARPDASGNMPAVTMPNGGYIPPGLSPADFGRKASEENALFNQAEHIKTPWSQHSASGKNSQSSSGESVSTVPATQGIAKEINERNRRENELAKYGTMENIAETKAAAAAKERSLHEDRVDARQNKALAAVASRIGGAAGTLSPEAIAALSKQYGETGELPGLGMGAAATQARSKVLNDWADKLNKTGDTIGDQQSRRGALKASRSELTKLQGQRGVVMAFAGTAEKNLNLAEKLSDKVDRTGVPAINRWLLAGKKSLAGDPDVAAFDAALRTGINEYAKVTSSATGGAVTSDTARKEIEVMLNDAHTKEQIKSVMSKVLRPEIQNRRQSYDDQIKFIRDSIKNSDKGPSGKPMGTPTGIDTSQPHRNKKTGVTGYLQEDGSYVDAAGKRLD